MAFPLSPKVMFPLGLEPSSTTAALLFSVYKRPLVVSTASSPSTKSEAAGAPEPFLVTIVVAIV